ncbi:MFS monosaccharide transporter-like protein [Patellaria atrata CBS 101060]|uniref:MFS monosaccharide transporter-like protein n=1 Tax=Patellaria atrata CBS 101060 TaxID=1346257 RepID=A0A9P4SDT9_9PEZI|nr:MFS monosaccharide transporter-like protein [Patellaria atrata CBS 101060]
MESTDEGSESRQDVVLAVTIAFLACSTVFVTLRLISRFAIVRKVNWDDYFMIFAWLISFGLSFAICYGTSKGLGRHQYDVPHEWNAALRRSEYTFSVLYNPALMATKTSILIFFLSLSKSQRIFRWATYSTLVVVNAAGFALTILNIIQCRPLGAAFKTPIPESATCTDIVTLYLSSAPVNIITDLAILILPMPILTSMRLPKKQKAILVVTFGFGIFVAVVDVVRIAYLQQAAELRLRNIQDISSNGDTKNAERNDFSWYASYTFMFSAIEVHVGIMCACVPAMKPLFSRYMPRLIRDDSDPETSFGSAFGPAMDSIKAAQRRSPPDLDPIPSPEPTRGTNTEDQVDMVDFLTTPDMQTLPPVFDSTQTQRTNTTRLTMTETPTFFDFVNVKKRKSMLQMTNKESYFPVAMVTILFFVWGFAYGLLDVLNSQFVTVSHMSVGQAIGIHSSYFGGYLVACLTFGRLVLKHWGFKACYIVGLCVYGCGTLVFWPSAVLTSFPAFLVSNFIVGMGLSTLEISANLFITLCGPPQWAEVRLNISQGIQAIGTVVSPLLAQKVLFKADASSLIQVQWTYLGICFFTILLALGFYYVPLPEATDDELERSADRCDGANTARIGGVQVVTISLVLGVMSQFLYVGGQEAISTSFSEYLAVVKPSINPVNHQAIGHSVFAISRFIAAALNLWFLQRHILTFFYLGTIAFAAAAMNFKGDIPAAMVILLYFFEGPIFILVFAMAIRGLGRRTKDGSAWLTAAISGGAFIPPIMHAVSENKGVQYSYCVVVAVFAFGSLLPLYYQVVPRARKLVDDPPLAGDCYEHGMEEDAAAEEGEGRGQEENQPVQRWSNLREGDNALKQKYHTAPWILIRGERELFRKGRQGTGLSK